MLMTRAAAAGTAFSPLRRRARVLGRQPVTLNPNGSRHVLAGQNAEVTTRSTPRTATVGTETERYRQNALARLVMRDQNTLLCRPLRVQRRKRHERRSAAEALINDLQDTVCR
jgi:hypothetical protein